MTTLIHQSITPDLPVDDKVLKDGAVALCCLYSDQFLMFADYINFKWNVLGPRAKQFCEMFCEFAECIECINKLTADHIRQYGFKVPAVPEVLKLVRIPLPPEGKWLDIDTMLRRLLDNHETIIANVARDMDRVVDDHVLYDFLINVDRKHRACAWKIRAHLEKEGNVGGSTFGVRNK